MIPSIKKILNFKLVQDALSLYSAHLFNVMLGFLATIFIVRYLPAAEYGEFGLFYTSQLIGSMVFEFGLFIVLGRLLALQDDEQKKKEFIAAGFILVLLLGVFMGICNWIAGTVIDKIFQVKAGYLFRKYWWITGSIAFHFFIWNVFEGTAEIKKLSLFIFLTKSSYFIYILIRIFAIQSLHAGDVIVGFLAPYSVWGLVFLILQKPRFKNIFKTIKNILNDTKAYGLHIYLSNALGFIAVKMDQYFVALFFGPQEMGYYHLASNIAHPLTLFSKSASTSAFRKIAQKKEMPRKMVSGLIGITTLGALAIFFIVPIFLTPVFTVKFAPILQFFPFVVAYHWLYALRIPYGMYFKAMAKGKFLLSASVLLIGLISVIEMLIRNHLGLKGPAMGMVLANALILLVLIVQYIRTKQESQNEAI
jgi:O-antigen/teichoic acid export membrane protein